MEEKIYTMEEKGKKVRTFSKKLPKKTKTPKNLNLNTNTYIQSDTEKELEKLFYLDQEYTHYYKLEKCIYLIRQLLHKSIKFHI